LGAAAGLRWKKVGTRFGTASRIALVAFTPRTVSRFCIAQQLAWSDFLKQHGPDAHEAPPCGLVDAAPI
jgi:hypothetical protein